MIFDGMPSMMDLRIGMAVNLTNSRYGLSGGKQGMVVGLKQNWSDMTSTVGIFI
jgi:hypothetical protein